MITPLLLMTFSVSTFFYDPPGSISPLEKFDPVWKEVKYKTCNTALKTRYHSSLEKDVIYILNLVRQYPQQFNNTVMAKWPEKSNQDYLRNNTYYQSLVAELAKMKPAPLLQPDSLAWVSAYCHAFTSGQNGYVGHDRQTEACEKSERFSGECCQYGLSTALDIVVSLLIDNDVPSLGHRIICLSSSYKKVGVSFQNHTGYGYNTVLDFSY